MVTRTSAVEVPRAVDPRTVRTRSAIIDAIERLDREGSALSVAAIAASAGISRTSFYAQFRDLGDVAVRLMRERYEEILRIDAELRAGGAAAEPTRETLSLLLDEFERHQTLYAAVLGSAGSGDAYRNLQGILTEGALETMRRVAPQGIDPEVAARFIAAGILATVIDALFSDNPPAPAELRGQIIDLLPVWVTTDSVVGAHTEPTNPSSPPRE